MQFLLPLVVKTTNLKAQTRMNSEVKASHRLIYKGRTLLEALAVEMTVWQCISTAKRGVTQGFPAFFADQDRTAKLKIPAIADGYGES